MRQRKEPVKSYSGYSTYMHPTELVSLSWERTPELMAAFDAGLAYGRLNGHHEGFARGFKQGDFEGFKRGQKFEREMREKC